jgi:hypothetical protein
MSALGQKATCAPQNVMSALPPKADMCVALAYVCFGPQADITPAMAAKLWEMSDMVKVLEDREAAN